MATASESESLRRLFLRLEVQAGRSVVDAAESLNGTGSKQQVFRERGLAGAGVSGKNNVAQARKIQVVHQHPSGKLGRSACQGRCAAASGPTRYVPAII